MISPRIDRLLEQVDSNYAGVIVAAKRARQLQGGARPVLPTSSKKPTIIAMEEVRRGLVKYELIGLPLVEEAPAPEVIL